VNIRNWLLLALIGVSFAFGAPRHASAATINFDVTFSATNFTALGSGSPVPLVLGHFTVTFDPSASVANASAALDYIDPLIMGPASFGYTHATDSLLLGGNISGKDAVVGGNTDFLMQILNFTSASPTLGLFYYSQAAIPNGLFGSSTGLVHVNAQAVAVAATPLPAALPLFAAALAGLGFAGWRRRKPAA
jgi:hypothetical protein